MAKSLFEPKRVPKYTENIIKPTTGLQAAPTPVRQRSVSTGTPKLAQATPTPPSPSPVAPPAPIAPPAPPVPVEETRAFSFDGATELTGSFTTAGGSTLRRGTLAFTARPGWSETTTGSFAIFSVNNPSDDTDYKHSVEFLRISGSTGYADEIKLTTSSGSHLYSHTMTNPLSPNFYSGSKGFTYFEVYYNRGSIEQVRIKKSPYRTYSQGITNKYNVTGTNSGRTSAIVTSLNNTDYEMSIGGLNSGSDNYYNGEIANLALSKNLAVFMGSQMPRLVVDNANVDIVYKFEGNLLASKGNRNLGVAGTETYVSSSI